MDIFVHLTSTIKQLNLNKKFIVKYVFQNLNMLTKVISFFNKIN